MSKNRDKISDFINLAIDELECDKTIDITYWAYKWFSRLNCKILFNLDDMEIIDNITNQFLYIINDFSNRQYMYLIPYALEFPTNNNYKLKKANKIIEDFIDNLDSNQDSVIYTLNNNNCSKTEIYSCIKLLFLAGFETTANTLIWCIYFLTKYPEYQSILNIDSPTEPTTKAYITAFINETVRSKPIVNNTSRVLTDYSGPILFYTKGLHYHENWIDPYTFRPERFLTSLPPNVVFMPFQIDNRKCIGMNIAYNELVMYIEKLIKKFHISLENKNEITEISKITLEPSEHILIKLKMRI
jgi:hypothetical protein